MLLTYGIKTARIKKMSDETVRCGECKCFGVTVKVYHDYYYIWYIPLMPIGDKKAKIYCASCGIQIRNEPMEKQYEEQVRKPFFLYTIPLLIILGISGVFAAVSYNNYTNHKYIHDPKLNDVYKVSTSRNTFSSFYFLKVVKVEKDAVGVLNSKYEYLFEPEKLSPEDYFIKEDSNYYSKAQLIKMADSNEIISVERNYNEASGFNRVK